MSNVITQDAQLPSLPNDGPVAFLNLIERASRDPNVDIDKMERLMSMHERMLAKQEEAAFNNALVECQKEARSIAADANNQQTRSRYATYAKMDKALRPIYTKHGISISFGTEESRPETVRVIAYVAKGGHTRIYRVDMPADGKGAKGGDVMTKTHATGAAMSYGARYLLKGIFNIAVGEDDTDGNDVRVTRMPEGQKVDFLSAIEDVTQETWRELWDKIVAATDRDADARDELRTAMAARRKSFK